jgi:hypothetical protein
MIGKPALAAAFFLSACMSSEVGLSNVAHAGWWGPSNYYECLVEKMKGQPDIMAGTVAAACIEMFSCNSQARNDFRKCMGNVQVINNFTVGYCKTESEQSCSQN